MVLPKPLEVRRDCSPDFPRVLDCKEMPDDLTIMFGLTRQTKRRILFSAISASDITWTLCDGSGDCARSVRGFGTLPFINADFL